MSSLNTKKNDVQPSNVYFDLTTTNFESALVEPQPFYFNESRANPYIQNPEDYFLTIARFTVDTGTLPVFIPSIVPNQGNRNLTIYNVVLSYTSPAGTAYFFTRPVIWDSQDNNASVPPPPSQTATKVQDNSTGYYNCYSYQYWCLQVYLAYELCFQGLNALVVAGGDVLPTTNSPILNWDSTANQGVLYTDVAGYDAQLANPIIVYMNSALYSLFGSFPAVYRGLDDVNLAHYRIITANVGNTNLIAIVPPPPEVQYDAIITTQEWSTQSAFNPIVALVFTSNTLPINATNVSTPLVFRDGVNLGISGSNSAMANIITDIVSDTGLYSPNLVYLPSAQYRLIDLFGTQPLYNLDISIYYRLKSGELQPFRLQSGGTVSMKLLFIKKNLYIKN
jgi:hypothetical protein